MRSCGTIWFVALLLFGLTAGCANHAPALQPIGNKAVQTGTTLEFTLFGYDDDGDQLQFGIEGKPAAAEFTQLDDKSALFRWTPIASDAGPDGRGQTYPVTFKVTDGVAVATEIVLVSVTLGGAGTGAPVFVSPSDHTLDLDRTNRIEFIVEVRDADSSYVNLSLVQGIPGAEFVNNPGSKQASVRWTPTADQIAERPVWSMRVSADDQVNPTVFQDVTVLLKGGGDKCEGTPPTVVHQQLADQRESGDYAVQASVTDAESAISAVVLYYLVDKGDGNSGTFEKHAMTNAGGNSWQGSIANPNLQAEATATVNYYICASDTDDPSGTCNLRACLPAEGRFTFTAYAPGNTTCKDDTFEPNDSSGAATGVADGSYSSLHVCPGNEDWYALPVLANDEMAAGIGFNAANGELTLDLFDQDGTTMLAAGEPGENQMVVYPDVFTQAKTVYLRVRGGVGIENNYNLVVVVDQYVPCNPDSFEPNDYPNQAKPITEDDYPGLTCCGEPDWYTIALNQGDQFEVLIEFATAQGDLDLWVFDPAVLGEQTLGCDNALACSTTETDDEYVYVPSIPADNTYYIAVGPYQGARNSYEMLVVVTAAGCPDDDSEPNDTPDQATGIWDSGPLTGRKVCPGNEDWYQTYMYAGETMVVDLTFAHADGDLDLKLYSPGVTPQTLSEHQVGSSMSSTDNEHAEYTVSTEGEYTIRVYGYNGAGNSYSVELSIQ